MSGSAVPPKLAANVRKVNLIVPSELLERVDHYRRTTPGLPNRSEALRALIQGGLEPTAKQKRKRPTG